MDSARREEVQDFLTSQTLSLKVEEIAIVDMNELRHFFGPKNANFGYGLLGLVTPVRPRLSSWQPRQQYGQAPLGDVGRPYRITQVLADSWKST